MARHRRQLPVAAVRRFLVGLAVAVGLAPLGCGGSSDGSARPLPPRVRLGAATSAHQVEGNQRNNWTLFETLPRFRDRVAEPSGIAVDHYTRFREDLDWVQWMGLDVHRMSLEWSRIEPERGRYDETQLAHYDAVLSETRARGIEPSVTLHHFTDPPWLVDLTRLSERPTRAEACAGGPDETNLCFWTNPEAREAFAAYCGLAAERYGDRVDEWWTVNELTAHWLNTSVAGEFPPAFSAASEAEIRELAVPELRALLDAHARCYHAIHARDLVDADGDGVAARVGLTTGTGLVRPARPGNAADVRAAAQAEALTSFLAWDAVETGMLDADLDGVPEEPHPEWAGSHDVLGLQFYASGVIVGTPVPLVPPLVGVPCLNLEVTTGLAPLDAALSDLAAELFLGLGCPEAPTADFPLGPEPPGRVYGRQHDPEGLIELLDVLARRYPGRPIVVTENGFADDPEKRASSIVRTLDAASRAVAAGAPLSGYYHWSLLDNFEWGRGFAVRFGLIAVDRDAGLARSPTVAAEVYRRIARARGVPADLLAARGGEGPLP